MENKDAVSDTSNWVDTVIAKLESATNGVLTVQVDGQTLQAVLGADVVAYFKTNKTLLLSLGLEMFKNFIVLVTEKKQEEAFNILVQAMDADAIIARLNMDAAQIQKYNDDLDAFKASLIKFAESTLEGLASKVLIGLLAPLI